MRYFTSAPRAQWQELVAFSIPCETDYQGVARAIHDSGRQTCTYVVPNSSSPASPLTATHVGETRLRHQLRGKAATTRHSKRQKSKQTLKSVIALPSHDVHGRICARRSSTRRSKHERSKRPRKSTSAASVASAREANVTKLVFSHSFSTPQGPSLTQNFSDVLRQEPDL